MFTGVPFGIDYDDLFEWLGEFFDKMGGFSPTVSAGLLGMTLAKKSPLFGPGMTQGVSVEDDPIRKEFAAFLARQDVSDEAKKERFFYKPEQRRPMPLESEPIETVTLKAAVRVDGLLNQIGWRRSVMLKSVFFGLKGLEDLIDGLVYFAMDVPVPQKGEKIRFTRIRKYAKENKLRLYDISDGDDYQMQPMFPRIAVKTPEGETTLRELSLAERKAVMEKSKQYASNMQLFTPSECKLMDLYLQGLTSYRVMKEMGDRDKSYIDNIRKSAGKKAIEVFDCYFNPKEDIALYWHEMGFYFPTA